MSRLTRRAEADGVKAVWYGNREVFLEGETGYAEADKLARYEDLEEAGRLIELPCKVGDTVYFLTTDGRILNTTLGDLNTVYRFKDLIGKAFYLTKAEAEAKLAELKGENNA